TARIRGIPAVYRRRGLFPGSSSAGGYSRDTSYAGSDRKNRRQEFLLYLSHFHSGQPSGHSPSGLHSLGSSQISLPENVPGDCCGADQGRVGFGGFFTIDKQTFVWYTV